MNTLPIEIGIDFHKLQRQQNPSRKEHEKIFNKKNITKKII